MSRSAALLYCSLVALVLGQYSLAWANIDVGSSANADVNSEDLSSMMERSISDLSTISDVIDSISDDETDTALESNRANEEDNLLVTDSGILDQSEWMIGQMWNLASNLPPINEHHATIVMQTIETLMIRVIETLTVVQQRPVRRQGQPKLIVSETSEISEWMVRQISTLASNLPNLRQRNLSIVMKTIEALMVRVMETIQIVNTVPKKSVVVPPPVNRKFRPKIRSESSCMSLALQLVENTCSSDMTTFDQCEQEVMQLAQAICNDPMGGMDELQRLLEEQNTIIVNDMETSQINVQEVPRKGRETSPNRPQQELKNNTKMEPVKAPQTPPQSLIPEQLDNNVRIGKQEPAIDMEAQQNNAQMEPVQVMHRAQQQSGNNTKAEIITQEQPKKATSSTAQQATKNEEVIQEQQPSTAKLVQQKPTNSMQASTNAIQQQRPTKMSQPKPKAIPNRMTVPPGKTSNTKNIIVRVLKEIAKVFQTIFANKGTNKATGQNTVKQQNNVPQANDLIGGLIEEGVGLAVDLATEINNLNKVNKSNQPGQPTTARVQQKPPQAQAENAKVQRKPSTASTQSASAKTTAAKVQQTAIQAKPAEAEQMEARPQKEAKPKKEAKPAIKAAQAQQMEAPSQTASAQGQAKTVKFDLKAGEDAPGVKNTAEKRK